MAMQNAGRMCAGILLLLCCNLVFSQQLKLGNNPSAIAKSAVLELNSTNQGLLFTRVADTTLINAQTPPDGMVIYFTPTRQLMVRSNAGWRAVLAGTVNSVWTLTGNAGTTPATQFLGTTDAQPLVFRTNNTEAIRLFSSGSLAIGATALDGTNPEKLLINAGVTSSVNALYAKGTIDKYFQINIQNLSTGTQASSDIVATANNGTESTNFVNLGINGSNFQYQAGNPIETGKANDCYLIGSGNDLYIVNNNATKATIFLIGGTAATNEAMRITPGENVGIATISPTAKLDVAGTYKLGAKGTVNKNQTNFAIAVPSTSVTAGGLNILLGTYTPGFADITITIPTANQPTTTQATVNVSPLADLPANFSIAFARMVTTSTLKIRILNHSTTSGLNYSGTMYITINEF